MARPPSRWRRKCPLGKGLWVLLEGLARAIGVSRVARVTGLDRGGVHVACAVRPRGHVLQVCNGKGRTAAAAEKGALLETAELHCAERPEPGLTHGSLAQLAALGAPAWGMDALGSAGALVAPRLWSEQVVCAWRTCVELLSGEQVLIPAVALHCPPPGSAPLGPAAVRWTSNGMGAHEDPDAALTHALFEAVERDGVARALPEGFRARELAARALSPKAMARTPQTLALAQRLEARGLRACLLDLSGPLAVPIAGALLVDLEDGPIPVTAGYAAAPTWDAALESALLEAAQSRLTDVHGAREDVAPMDRAAALRLRQLVERTAPSLNAPRCKPLREPNPGEPPSNVLVQHLARRGVEQLAAVELSSPELPVRVVKVVVPGFLVSELL